MQPASMLWIVAIILGVLILVFWALLEGIHQQLRDVDVRLQRLIEQVQNLRPDSDQDRGRDNDQTETDAP